MIADAQALQYTVLEMRRTYDVDHLTTEGHGTLDRTNAWAYGIATPLTTPKRNNPEGFTHAVRTTAKLFKRYAPSINRSTPS